MGPSLFQVKKIWHYRFQIHGARVQRTTGEASKRKAELIAARAYDDAQLATRGMEPIPVLRELVQQWLKVHESTVSDSHLRGMEQFGRLHLYDLADLRLDQITTALVEAARVSHLDSHAPSTANHWARLLRLVFKWAVRRKLIAEVPWILKPLKVQKKPRAMLPARQALDWLDAIDAQQRPAISRAIRLMLGLGLREVEARTAQWEWIDWERRTYTPGRTKGREAVPVPMPDWLLHYLAPLCASSGLIVANRRGHGFAAGFTSRYIKAANAMTGVEGLTPHRLRGTFATMLSEAGVPVQTIQRVLRHKSVLTTIGYLEVDIEQAVRGQDQVARKLGFHRDDGSVRSGEDG
ncbi:site-specific recombinase XerD [Paraburkholderia sp. BL6665CI2N2]|uniref:tyrosine-type recombinase/integrase n=1 Tax=Paraburkholderia sp. BL6665CI2N2 TaxID=1938806 RepID=UPI0010657A5F|nr:tyrosine-type recombinase/integrase [Paraburkholderia sp. BL6665CI2N2]TDY26285.1 site-specific recombinase XerD [Paraburkholderia sp. BL6665CI2N2]